MIVAHMKKRISERTGKPFLEGSTDYELPKGTPLYFQKCNKHDDCYQLWAVTKQKPAQYKVQGVIF